MYPCPETAQERRDTAIGVMTRIEDLKTVLGQTQDHRHRVLVAAAKNIRMWFTKVSHFWRFRGKTLLHFLQVRKIKAIYHTLNLFNMDVTSKALVAECWAPINDLDKIQMALQRATVRALRSMHLIISLLSLAGGKRLYRAEYSQPHRDKGDATNLPPHEQDHEGLPKHCRRVWPCELSRN